MIYRLVGNDRIAFTDDNGVDHQLDPARDYDDKNPEDKALIKARPGFFRSYGDVEAATAAPGEKRTTRR